MPNADVIAIRVRNNAEKEMLVEAEPAKFFTEPHYNGFPVLVRLAAVDVEELEVLLLNGWRCQAPPVLVKGFDQRNEESGSGSLKKQRKQHRQSYKFRSHRA